MSNLLLSNLIECARSELGRSNTWTVSTYNKLNPLPRGYKLKSSDSWCAGFISACMAAASKYDMTLPYECSCEEMIKRIKSNKYDAIWYENENMVPNVGDLVFYDWQDTGKPVNNTGWADHVGVVEEIAINQSTFVVIEGNSNHRVDHRVVKVNQQYLRGFGRIKFKAGTSRPVTRDLVLAVINGKYKNAPKRQELLEREGYNYAEVQQAVNNYLKQKH